MTDPTTGVDVQPRMLYKGRVPVVFDHLNDPLRHQLRDREVQFKQLLGRGVTIAGDLDVRQDATESAIALVETALERIGLAPTPDERGLSVVHSQVITTPLTSS